MAKPVFKRRIRRQQPKRDSVGRIVRGPREQLVDKSVVTQYGTGRGDEVTPTSASTYFP